MPGADIVGNGPHYAKLLRKHTLDAWRHPDQAWIRKGTRYRPRLAPKNSGWRDFGWQPRPPRTGWFGL